MWESETVAKKDNPFLDRFNKIFGADGTQVR